MGIRVRIRVSSATADIQVCKDDKYRMAMIMSSPCTCSQCIHGWVREGAPTCMNESLTNVLVHVCVLDVVFLFIFFYNAKYKYSDIAPYKTTSNKIKHRGRGKRSKKCHILAIGVILSFHVQVNTVSSQNGWKCYIGNKI